MSRTRGVLTALALAACAFAFPAQATGATDAGYEPVQSASSSDGGRAVIESFENVPGSSPAVESFESPVQQSGAVESFDSPPSLETFEAERPPLTAQVFGTFRTQLGVDTRFDSARREPLAENVVDLQGRLWLGADARLSDRLRLRVEGRARWRGVAQRAFDRSKASFEPTLGEAYVDLYTPKVDLRAGNQLVAFGANAAFAPADGLNPRDLREAVLLSGELEDSKLPAFGLRALGELSGFSWTAAYFPFFTPNRYTVFGQDEALLQPGIAPGPPVNVDESIEDELQPHLLESRRPKAWPWLGDLGLRVVREVGRVKLGASWVWMNERLPRVELDPELATLLSSGINDRKPDPAVGLSVQNRLAAGERLATGTYGRQHLISLEASTLVSSCQLDVDLSYSPRQTFFDGAMSPVSKQSVTWVVGVSQAEDSPLLYALTYVGIAVPNLDAAELLLLIEPTTAQGAARTAYLHLLAGTVGYRFKAHNLELSVRGAFEPIQRSFALAPRLSYDRFEKVVLWVGAEIDAGPVYSPFGYFNRNDQVLAGAVVTLF